MSQRRHMSHRDTGPKLADTSRDKVGVLIEVIPPFQRLYSAFVFSGKRRQIELHPLSQRQHEVVNVLLIAERQCFEEVKTLRQAGEQLSFGMILLLFGKGRSQSINTGRLLSRKRRPVLLKIGMPLRARKQHRIGDRVRGAAEEIGETDSGSHARRQHPQAQIKRATHARKNVREKLSGGLGKLHGHQEICPTFAGVNGRAERVAVPP
jgi:hypothetical protein